MNYLSRTKLRSIHVTVFFDLFTISSTKIIYVWWQFDPLILPKLPFLLGNDHFVLIIARHLQCDEFRKVDNQVLL